MPPRRKGNNNNNNNNNGSRAAGSAAAGHDSDDETLYSCLICTDPCTFFGVFDCGHYTCGTCALRIFSLGKQPCPICRKASTRLIITDSKHPGDDDTFDVAIFAAPFQPRAAKAKKSITAGCGEAESAAGSEAAAPAEGESLQLVEQLGCFVDGERLAARAAKMVDFLCPMPECWSNGTQEPFRLMTGLHSHLRAAHQSKYCGICLEHRPVFLCEQKVYTDGELEQHNKGKCRKDSPIFQGHPMCLYCGRRFYDGEMLLKHMMHQHYTCDVCNSREFIFTFYKSRPKLLEHFGREHKLCTHPDCASLDPMERVFRSDVELQSHMQRVHGAQARSIDLTSFGFRFGVGASSGPSSSPPSSSSPAGPRQSTIGAPGVSANGVASAGSTHAVRIVFDHVSRREEVNMLPTTTRTDHETQHVSMPAHYEERSPALLRRRPPAAPKHVPSRTPAAPAGAPIAGASSEADNEDRALFDGIRGGPKRTRGRRSGGGEPEEPPVAPAAAAVSAATPQATHAPLPTDPKALNALLKERLTAHLQPAKLEDFKRQSGRFLSNELLAVEYFAVLSAFFPERAALEDVFEPLVATLPNVTKREALIAAKKMLLSNEAQKIEEIRRADEAKAKAAAAAERKKHAWGKKGPGASPTAPSPLAGLVGVAAPSAGGGGGSLAAALRSTSSNGVGAAGGVGQWASSAGASRGAATVSPAPASTASSPTASVDAAFAPVAAGAGAGGGGRYRAPPPATLHEDPEMFPTLDRNPTRPPKGKKSSMSQWSAGASAAATSSKSSVWFTKNKK